MYSSFRNSQRTDHDEQFLGDYITYIILLATASGGRYSVSLAIRFGYHVHRNRQPKFQPTENTASDDQAGAEPRYQRAANAPRPAQDFRGRFEDSGANRSVHHEADDGERAD